MTSTPNTTAEPDPEVTHASRRFVDDGRDPKPKRIVELRGQERVLEILGDRLEVRVGSQCGSAVQLRLSRSRTAASATV